MVLLEHGGHVPLSSGVTDDNVRENPIPIVALKVVYEHMKPGMARLAAHDIVTERSNVTICREGWQVSQCVKIRGASLSIRYSPLREKPCRASYIIQVDIDSTIMM